MLTLINLLIFMLVALTNAQRSIKVTSCGGQVVDVVVTPCDSEPCIFKKGSSVRVSADFIPLNDADQLKISVKARMAGVQVSFPGLRTNACKGMGIECPIKAGQKINWFLDIEIRPTFPAIETIGTFTLSSPAGTEFCFEAPVTIQ